MMVFLYMLRLFAMFYEIVFILAGSALLALGLYLSAMAASASGPATDIAAAGMVSGPPLIGLGFLLLCPLILAVPLRTFSPESIWPMIGVFITFSLFIWFRKLFAFISFPFITAFCNIPNYIVNAVIALNLAAVVFLVISDYYSTIRRLSSRHQTFYIQPDERTLALALAFVIVVLFGGWILFH